MKQPPIFISVETCNYSGATLLSFLLGQHPQIATVGEMDGIIAREVPDEYLCSCGQRILECDFWQSIKNAMQKRGFEFNIAHFNTKYEHERFLIAGRLRDGLSGSKALDSIRDLIFEVCLRQRHKIEAHVAQNVAFVESVLDVTGKKAFVDTSKGQRRSRHILKFSLFDVRFVHLVRDVRGVVASHIRHNRKVSPALAATLWVKVNKKIEKMLKDLPEDKWKRISYESLCLDLQKNLDCIYQLCSLDSFVAKNFRSFSHHIIGNEMRLEKTAEIKLDERWKLELSAKQLEEIKIIAGRLNQRYGYE
jgi:hypothetical protein